MKGGGPAVPVRPHLPITITPRKAPGGRRNARGAPKARFDGGGAENTKRSLLRLGTAREGRFRGRGPARSGPKWLETAPRAAWKPREGPCRLATKVPDTRRSGFQQPAEQFWWNFCSLQQASVRKRWRVGYIGPIIKSKSACYLFYFYFYFSSWVEILFKISKL